MEQAIVDIDEGTSSTLGEDFFRFLVRHLAAALHVRFAFVAELHKANAGRVRLLALWQGDDFSENFEYAIQGTPCEQVIGKKIAFFPNKVQESFPDDDWLKKDNIESYLAIPLFDKAGRPLGHLGVMHDQPMSEAPFTESILRIFATCAAAELERKRAKENLHKQNTVLRKLASSKNVVSGNLKSALKEITEVAAQTLNVERVNIWRYNKERTKIECLDQYELGTKRHSDGYELAASNFPSYFKALKQERTIAAHDAHKDPRTKEFSRTYLTSLGIASMLDAPIRLGDKMIGVICHEHVGSARRWTLEEQHFAGSMADFVSLAMEAGQRRQAEEALLKSEQRFRALYENIPLMYFTLAGDGTVISVNKFGAHQLGFTVDELVGRSVLTVFHKDERKKVLDQLKLCFQEPESVYEWQLRKVRKDGSVLWVEERARLVHGSDGQPTLLIVCQDITERKRLEEQLLQSQKMEAVGRLAGGVAHDFNNLLTVILCNVDFGLQESPPEAPIIEDLRHIEKAANQARDLTSHLLTFSRNRQHKPQVINLNFVIVDQMKLLIRLLGEHIEIKTNLDPKLKAIWADPAQIQQILMNLAVNARDAMPKGGKLTISTQNFIADDKFLIEEGQLVNQNEIANESRAYVLIKVKDTGSGIERKNQAHIFEPFFTTKQVGKGTGLGLAVVYGIVKKHHGVIQVQSKLKKGTCFKIYFPAMRKSETIEDIKTGPEAIKGGKETILVVEDEKAVLNTCVRILKPFGYNVITAQSGEEALHLFNKDGEKIDLVVMDVVMPEMSGPDTFRELNVIKPELPVIFVTGYDIHDEILQVNDLPAKSVAVLQKPYTKESLGGKVREILDQLR